MSSLEDDDDEEFCDNCGSQDIFRTKTRLHGTFCEDCFNTLIPKCYVCKTLIFETFNKTSCHLCGMTFCISCYLEHKDMYELGYDIDTFSFRYYWHCGNCGSPMCNISYSLSKCKICSKEYCKSCNKSYIIDFCCLCWTVLICRRMKPTLSNELIMMILKLVK